MDRSPSGFFDQESYVHDMKYQNPVAILDLDLGRYIICIPGILPHSSSKGIEVHLMARADTRRHVH